MVDEFYDRGYQAARAQLNDDIGNAAARLARSVGHAFAVLNRIEYRAPWLDDREPHAR